MGLHGLSTEHRLYEMCMSWSSLMTKLPLLLTGCRTCARSWQRWKSERCLSFSSSVMSVELGLGISSSDILKHAMSREMGGWPYNDIWTQSLQNSASLPYTAGLALSDAMQQMPGLPMYVSPVNRSAFWGLHDLSPATCIKTSVGCAICQRSSALAI